MFGKPVSQNVRQVFLFNTPLVLIDKKQTKKNTIFTDQTFMNLSRFFATLHIELWHVQVVQPQMVVHQKVVKIMGLAAPIAAIN